MFQTVFKRYENKYFVNPAQYSAVLEILERNAVPDEYGKSRICSIYYDTPDKRLIRASLEKPVYKEKLRLRTYGVPDGGSQCFIEIKKKYKGVVSKRRIGAAYSDGLSYMSGGAVNIKPSQIKKEIEYFKSHYGALAPSADIFYSRLAFFDRQDRNVRITFDSDIVFRTYGFDLSNGDSGEPVLQNGVYLMEIKTAGAMPLWTARMLTELKIYPASFSKYGTAYKKLLSDGGMKKIITTGGNCCA